MSIYCIKKPTYNYNFIKIDRKMKINITVVCSGDSLYSFFFFFSDFQVLDEHILVF